MQGNFSVLKDFSVMQKGIVICAQGMNLNVSLSGTRIYKREHD